MLAAELSARFLWFPCQLFGLISCPRQGASSTAGRSGEPRGQSHSRSRWKPRRAARCTPPSSTAWCPWTTAGSAAWPAARASPSDFQMQKRRENIEIEALKTKTIRTGLVDKGKKKKSLPMIPSIFPTLWGFEGVSRARRAGPGAPTLVANHES